MEVTDSFKMEKCIYGWTPHVYEENLCFLCSFCVTELKCWLSAVVIWTVRMKCLTQLEDKIIEIIKLSKFTSTVEKLCIYSHWHQIKFCSFSLYIYIYSSLDIMIEKWCSINSSKPVES